MSVEENSQSLAEALMAKHGVADSPAESISESATSTAVPSDVESESVNPTDENTTTPSSSASSPKVNGSTKKNLDISSYDAFPILGGGKASTASAVSWGPNATVKPVATPKAPARTAAKPTQKSIVTESFTLKLEQRNARAKTIPSEVLSRAQSNNSVSIDCSTSKSTRASHFIIKGKLENVHKARRELLRELSIRVTEVFQVPASVRALIIGPKGSNLRPITERSGTQIQITKKEDTPVQSPDDDEDEIAVDVKVEGDPEGVQLAKKDILAIVASRVRTANIKIQGLPSKIYPSLAKSSQISKFETEKDLKINIPDFFYLNANKLNAPITISGERNAALEAKAHLESLAQTIASTYTSSIKNIPVVSKPFVNAPEIFNNTGVVVVEIPDSANQLELYGPDQATQQAGKLIDGISKQLHTTTLAISKSHGANLPHSKALATYFERSGKFKEVETSNSVIVTVNSSPSEVSVVITGKDADNVTVARKQIINLVNSIPPEKVLVISDIEPFFLKYLSPKSKLAAAIKEQDSVEIYTPADNEDSRDIIFVYQENDDENDFAPAPHQIKEKLNTANALLNDIRNNQKDIVSKVLDIPVENHKFILGPNGTTLNAILKGGDGDSFVSVQLGNEVAPEDSSVKLTPSSVYIRGLSSEVARVVKEIEEVIEQAKNYEVLSSYTTDFQFPAEHVNKLIGKGGANLTKIREEFGVKIDVDEKGNGVVKGIKKNADEAKVRILNLGRRLADEVSLRVKVPNEYHATIIGTGGKFVKRLEEKYDVHIRFPRNNDSNEEKADKNEVLIRGPSRGAAKAQEEILELLQYEIDNSHSQVVNVPAGSLSRIIGRNGEYINDIKDTTNTRIDVPNQSENGDAATVPITITGTKTGVKHAVERIQEIVKEIEDTVTEEIEVDPKYHRILIGSNGSAMREIVAQAGETSNSRVIQIPQAGSGDKKIKIHGKKKVVAKVIKIIQDIVSEQESRVEINVPVNPQRHGALIGPGGSTKKEIETTFNVSLFVPKQGSKNADGEIDTNIRVTGKPENVEKAKAKIEELTAEVFKATVDVPKKYHALISDNGLFIRKLRTNYNVRVDHNRVPFPKDASVPIPVAAIGETAGDANPESLFKWTIAKDTTLTEGSDSETIPWRLRGSDSDAAKAKEEIEKALAVVKNYTSIGYLWLADPSKYRLVVGPKGKTINSIRNKSQCIINVPKSDASETENVIVMRGNEEQLEKAKVLVLEAIARG
ncbi:hypothetical protein DV451_003503 [Geotrichum candidum]|uniref:K Homology domain-containing protein n=1 Tax=Geotrichum candidum TaxID=1173061 RepID=A0A9P5G4N8_GEOCN|nr:hypothetical protein DV451_003503 [Geotrichum candidum]